jgi:hypothetical protein
MRLRGERSPDSTKNPAVGTTPEDKGIGDGMGFEFGSLPRSAPEL